MRALVLGGANQPFKLMDVPDPVAGPGEAVAKVYASRSRSDDTTRQGWSHVSQFPTYHWP